MWRDLLSSVTSLARLSLAGAELLVFAELVLQLCAELGAARGLLTSALVDVVLQWTRPRTNKRTEQLHARAALGLVRKVAVIIYGDSRLGDWVAIQAIGQASLVSTAHDWWQYLSMYQHLESIIVKIDEL